MAYRWRSLRSGDLLRFFISYGRRILILNTQHRRRSRLCRSLLHSGLPAKVDWRCTLPTTLVTEAVVLHDRPVLLPSIVGAESCSGRRRFVFCRPDCATVASDMFLHLCHLLACGRSLCSVWIYTSLHGISLLLRHHRNNGCDIPPVISAKWTPYLPRAQPSTAGSFPAHFWGSCWNRWVGEWLRHIFFPSCATRASGYLQPLWPRVYGMS